MSPGKPGPAGRPYEKCTPGPAFQSRRGIGHRKNRTGGSSPNHARAKATPSSTGWLELGVTFPRIRLGVALRRLVLVVAHRFSSSEKVPHRTSHRIRNNRSPSSRAGDCHGRKAHRLRGCATAATGLSAAGAPGRPFPHPSFGESSSSELRDRTEPQPRRAGLHRPPPFRPL